MADPPEAAGGASPEKEGSPAKTDRLVANRADDGFRTPGDLEVGDVAEPGSDSGETELVPETEEMEEETEEQGGEGQEWPSPTHERALSTSPCRASESPIVAGSQPLSQSQVC